MTLPDTGTSASCGAEYELASNAQPVAVVRAGEGKGYKGTTGTKASG